MILTQHARVLLATDYDAYQSLNKLSQEFGYASQKTFARVVAALQQQTQKRVRVVKIGRRIKFNRHDIRNLLS
jgi:hypothetical protein